MPLGTLKLPTVDQLRDVAADLGMTFSDDDLAQHRDCLVGGIAAYNIIDQMPDEIPAVAYPRLPGTRPCAEATSMGHGTSRPPSRARRRASSKASGSRSRTTSWSPACR